MDLLRNNSCTCNFVITVEADSVPFVSTKIIWNNLKCSSINLKEPGNYPWNGMSMVDSIEVIVKMLQILYETDFISYGRYYGV